MEPLWLLIEPTIVRLVKDKLGKFYASNFDYMTPEEYDPYEEYDYEEDEFEEDSYEEEEFKEDEFKEDDDDAIVIGGNAYVEEVKGLSHIYLED